MIRESSIETPQMSRSFSPKASQTSTGIVKRKLFPILTSRILNSMVGNRVETSYDLQIYLNYVYPEIIRENTCEHRYGRENK